MKAYLRDLVYYNYTDTTLKFRKNSGSFLFMTDHRSFACYEPDESLQSCLLANIHYLKNSLAIFQTIADLCTWTFENSIISVTESIMLNNSALGTNYRV